MILGFGNNVVSSLASDITSGQTSIPVFPGDGPLFAALLTSDFSNNSTELKKYAKITLTDSGETAFEICHLLSVSGDTLTVVRGQEGTAAKGWSLKDVVANFATRGSENAFTQIAHVQSGFYTAGNAGGTANALTLNLPTTFFLNGSADWVLKTPIVVYPTQNNTGPATLQLTMGGRVLGTFKLYKGNKAELVANDILKDVALVCLLDNTKTFFNVANPGAIYAGLGSAAFRNVADNAPGDLVPVGYKGTYKSEANHGAIDFATYPFVVGESLFIDVRGCTNNPPFLNQDFYYIDVVCATGPAQGGRVNRPLIQFVSYTNSKLTLAIREDDGTTVGWRYFQGVQFDANSDNITLAGDITAKGFITTGRVSAGDISTNYVKSTGDLRSERNISCAGIVEAGAGLYDTPGVRVYSPNNMPPQQDLSPYATTAWVGSYFVQGMRLGAQGAANNNDSGWAVAPNGAVLTASYQETNYTAVYYRYPQYNINGTWYNTGAI